MSFVGAGVMATTSDVPADHGRVRFWDEGTGRELPLPLSLERGDCYRVIAGKNNRPLLFVSRTGTTVATEPRLEAWDLQTGAKLAHPVPLADRSGTRGPRDRDRFFVALPRGETLRTQFYTERGGPVYCWDLETGMLALPPWNSPVAPVYQLSTDGSRVLAVQCRDDRIRLFDLETGTQLGGTLTIPGMVTPQSPTHVSVGMALSADGSVLVTLESDGTVRGWGLKDILEQSRPMQRQCPTFLPPVSARSSAKPVVALRRTARVLFSDVAKKAASSTRQRATRSDPRSTTRCSTGAVQP